MPGFMRIRVWDVGHGCCAMVQHVTKFNFNQEVGGRLAMIDSGSTVDFKPSTYIKELGRNELDYLFITNADQDDMSDLKGLEDAGISNNTLIRNPSYTGEQMRKIKQVSGSLTGDATWSIAKHRLANRLPYSFPIFSRPHRLTDRFLPSALKLNSTGAKSLHAPAR